MLKLSRQDGASLEAVEDPSDYTAEECNNLLSRIHEGNANHGGLQLVCEVRGSRSIRAAAAAWYICIHGPELRQGLLVTVCDCTAGIRHHRMLPLHRELLPASDYKAGVCGQHLR